MPSSTPHSTLGRIVVSVFLLAPLLAWVVFEGALDVRAQQQPAPPPPPEAAPPAPAPEPIRVVGTIPLPGEALQNHIVIFFDRPITVSGDPQPPAMLVEPEANGPTRMGENFVSLWSPDFQFGQIYRVELSDAIRSADGATIDPAQRRLTFATFTFQPARVWTIEEGPPPVLGLNYPAPVDIESLRTRVTILDAGGQNVPFEIQPGSEENSVRLVLASEPAWPVAVQTVPGIADRTGGLQQLAPQTLSYPEVTQVVVTEVTWSNFLPDLQDVVLRFSQAVKGSELQAHLSIRQAEDGTDVPYELQANPDNPQHEHVARLHMDLGQPVKLLIEISAGLPGAEQTVLPAAYTTRLDRTDEPLRIDNMWWGRENRDGLVLHFELSNHVELQDLQQHLKVEPELPQMRVERRYSNNFSLHGVWDSEKQYTISLQPGMKYGGVGVLAQAVSRVETSQKVPSFLGFGHPGKFYFPRQGGLSLPLESRNVTKARLSLFELFPSNLVVALRDQEQSQEDSPVISWSGPKGTRELDLPVQADRIVETPLNLGELFPDKRGVFVLQATEIKKAEEQSSEDEEYYYTPGPQSKLILMTDIGLLAHWRNNELVLFAHDLYTLAPLKLARVSVYSNKNQLLGQGNTDEQGIAHLSHFDPALGTPKVAVAEMGTDFTFLELQPRPDDVKAVDAGLPNYDRAGYDAFIYADRELYRPGEPVHLAWTVRTHYGDALRNVPLLVTVIKPNGRDLLSRPTVLSGFGTGTLDLPTQRIYPTGLYTVRLSVPGSEAALGTYTFHLEDFVPNRMKVALEAPAGPWVAGQPYEVKLNAQHLFGAPAADRKAQGLVIFRRDALQLEGWKEFRFDNDSEYVPEPVQMGDARTDDAGNTSFQFTWTPPVDVTFPVKAAVVGRVLELGGRAVAGREERTVFPSPIALGVATTPGPGGQGVEVHAAAVNPDGTPAVLDKVQVTLERESWDYYVRRYYSHYESNFSRRFETVETREVPLTDGRGSTTFSFDDYGHYRVRVHSDQTPQFSTLMFYAYGYQYQVVDAARPSLVKITTDKPTYAVGEEAVVRIESPFDGQGILVVQGEEIQQMIPVAITGGKAEVRLPVGEEQFPNVWLEATIIHTVKTERTQVYPFSSFGMVMMDVENPKRKLEVTIPGLPDEVRPAQQITVPVEVRDSAGNPMVAEVTIAAVDEGIHSITGYKNPDPYAWLSRPRRPDFRRAHYYDKVVYDFTKPSPGGDLDSEMGKRASAVEENWIRPLALWSGVVTTGPDGRAAVTFELPEFAGELRIVAVASSERALGAAADSMLVRRPFMLRTSMPRFLLPGDRADCRAVVFNNSDMPATATVSWSVGGALSEGQGSQALELPPHQEATLLASVAAGTAVGQGELRWGLVVTDARGLELERIEERALLPVRPPAAYQSAHDLAVLAPGESRMFKNERFLDDERTELEITVGASPTLRLEDALKWLVGYPYGCIEQTTSRLMPTYLLRKHEALVKSTLEREGELQSWVQAGITRLFSMQTTSGGLGFWPGARDPYPYGSVYALHFLTLVKNDREFEVAEESFRLLQNYVRGVATDWNSGTTPDDLYRRAYATYVLALDGDMEAVRQIERFDALTIPTAARYLLAAALAHNTKDIDRVKLYLESRPMEPFLQVQQAGSLNSPIRSSAVRLLALKQMGGDPQAMLELANELVDFLATHRYGNTQETAFIISALAEYLSGIDETLTGAAATVSGQGREVRVEGRDVFRAQQDGPGAAFTVTNPGTTPMYVSLTTRGVPAQAATEPVSEGMSVARRLLTSRGEAKPEGAFNQGETYVIEVQVKCEGELKNVIVADLLPAGLEIENPRLDPEAFSGEVFKNAVTPTYLDLRDDRLVAAFDTLSGGTHRFYYVVRAVTPGQFQHPPVAAECMYDARFRASTVPTQMQVQ